jgi:hypothetical protein
VPTLRKKCKLDRPLSCQRALDRPNRFGQAVSQRNTSAARKRRIADFNLTRTAAVIDVYKTVTYHVQSQAVVGGEDYRSQSTVSTLKYTPKSMSVGVLLAVVLVPYRHAALNVRIPAR